MPDVDGGVKLLLLEEAVENRLEHEDKPVMEGGVLTESVRVDLFKSSIGYILFLSLFLSTCLLIFDTITARSIDDPNTSIMINSDIASCFQTVVKDFTVTRVASLTIAPMVFPFSDIMISSVFFGITYSVFLKGDLATLSGNITYRWMCKMYVPFAFCSLGRW